MRQPTLKKSSGEELVPARSSPSSAESFSKAATDVKTGLKNGAIGDAIKGVPDAIARAGSTVGEALKSGNNILNRSVADNINSNPTLKSAMTAATASIASGQQQLDKLTVTGDSLTNQGKAKIASIQADLAKSRASQAKLQKTARENAEKAAKTQRLAQQAQALKQLNDRLAKV